MHEFVADRATGPATTEQGLVAIQTQFADSADAGLDPQQHRFPVPARLSNTHGRSIAKHSAEKQGVQGRHTIQASRVKRTTRSTTVPVNRGLLTYDALRAKGYGEEDECVLTEGVPVQFLPAYNELLEEALQEARDILDEGTATRVLRVKHLAAICVQTGKDKDRERARLARARGFGPELSSRGVGSVWS